MAPMPMFGLSPMEGHLAIFPVDEAEIGDSDTMGIPAQIGQHLFRPAEKRFGINDPVATTCRGQETREGLWIGEFGDITEELWVSDLKGCKRCLKSTGIST